MSQANPQARHGNVITLPIVLQEAFKQSPIPLHSTAAIFVVVFVFYVSIKKEKKKSILLEIVEMSSGGSSKIGVWGKWEQEKDGKIFVRVDRK